MKKKKKENIIEKNKKQVLIIALAIVLLLGGSYAWLQITLRGTKTTKIEAGTLKLELAESEGINLEDTLPLSDLEGLKTEAYTFSVANTGNITSDYEIYLDDVAVSEKDVAMEDRIVKYSITKNEGTATTALLSSLTNRKLISGQLEAGVTDTYTLRLWIDKDATNEDIQVEQEDGTYVGKVFKAKLRIEASQIKE